MLHSPRLALVILAVSDLDRAARFYEGTLGWSVAVDVPVYREFKLPDGMRLGLYLRDAFTRNTMTHADVPASGCTTSTELYLHVDNPAPWGERLVAHGARCLSPLAARPWGDEAAYYEDPDGNVVVVACPLRETSEGDGDSAPDP